MTKSDLQDAILKIEKRLLDCYAKNEKLTDFYETFKGCQDRIELLEKKIFYKERYIKRLKNEKRKI